MFRKIFNGTKQENNMKTAFIILAVVALFSFVMNYYCCKAVVSMDERIRRLEARLSAEDKQTDAQP